MKNIKLKKGSNNLLNIIIIAVIFIALIVYMISADGLDNIVNVIKNVNPIWMLLGLLFIIVYWLLESLNLHIITKKIYPKQKIWGSIRVSMIGQLFNCITPFSSGGQPIQAIAMVNEGKSITNSATILLIKFIVFQATLVLYTLVVLVFQYSYFNTLVSNFINLALIGFVINLAVIVFLILIGVNEKIVFNFLKPIYKFLGKIKVFKDVDEKLEKLKKSVVTFHEQFKIIKEEKWMIFKSVIFTVIQHTAFFAITYAVYRSFGQSGESIVRIMSAQAFLMMIMAFVPIPGAGIAAEGGFFIIFNTFFEKHTINMAILFWRMYTFYLPIIVGSIFMIRGKKKGMIKKEDVKNIGSGGILDAN